MHSSALSGSRLSPRGSPDPSPKPPLLTELAGLVVPKMASLRRRASLTSDTGIDGLVESLSAFRHYNQIYMGYRADHLSQGSVPLYRLGASSGAQKDWRDHYVTKLEPPNTELDGLVLTRANWQEYWGKQEAFRAFLRFFEGELVRIEADTRRARLSADIDNEFAAQNARQTNALPAEGAAAAAGASADAATAAAAAAAAEAASEAAADVDFDVSWQRLIAEVRSFIRTWISVLVFQCLLFAVQTRFSRFHLYFLTLCRFFANTPPPQYYPQLSGGMLGSALHPTIQAGWAVPLLREAADSLAHARALEASAVAAPPSTASTAAAAAAPASATASTHGPGGATLKAADLEAGAATKTHSSTSTGSGAGIGTGTSSSSSISSGHDIAGGVGAGITMSEPPPAPLTVTDALALRAAARNMLIEGLAWCASAYFPASLCPPSPSLAPARAPAAAATSSTIGTGAGAGAGAGAGVVGGGMALQRRLSQLYTAAFAEIVQFFTRAASPPATPAAAAMRKTMAIDGDDDDDTHGIHDKGLDDDNEDNDERDEAGEHADRKSKGDLSKGVSSQGATGGKGAVRPAGLPLHPTAPRKRTQTTSTATSAGATATKSGKGAGAGATPLTIPAFAPASTTTPTGAGAGLTDGRPTRLASITITAAARARKGGNPGLLGRLAALQRSEAEARHTRWVAERTIAAALAAAAAADAGTGAGGAPGAGAGSGAVLEAVAAPLAALLAVVDYASGNDFFALHCT